MQRGCRSVEDCHAERRVSRIPAHREATGLLWLCRSFLLMMSCREAVDLLRTVMHRGYGAVVTVHTGYGSVVHMQEHFLLMSCREAVGRAEISKGVYTERLSCLLYDRLKIP